MKYDKRHFRKFEDLVTEVRWAQEEVDYHPYYDKKGIRELKEIVQTARWELAQYRKTHPGILKAYNKFIREGGDTF